MALPATLVRLQVEAEKRISERGDGGYEPERWGRDDLPRPFLPQLRSHPHRFVPLTFAHELHHAARILEGPGYGSTLQEALVTEGLADSFSLQVFSASPPPPWVRALDRDSTCSLWNKVQREFDRPSYDHGRWFLGDEQIPRWAGYTLGYRLVQTYLDDHPDTTPAGLVETPAAELIRGADLCL